MGVRLVVANVSVQVTDVAAFGETQSFFKQMDHLVEQCANSKPANSSIPVRVPGQRGLALKREQLEKGVLLHEDIMPALKELLTQSGIKGPLVIQ